MNTSNSLRPASRDSNQPTATPALHSFTPGPWAVEQGDNVTRIVGTGQNSVVIAEHSVWPVAEDEAQANARLIAAAPDLLAALVELVERAEAEGEIDGLPEYNQARAAIARATQP